LSQSKKSTGILPEAIVTIKEIHWNTSWSHCHNQRNPLEYFLKPLSQSKKSTGILPEAIVTIN
jgi:hypothetical protein